MNPINIICISSEYCSRGRYIAMDFVKKSGFKYYDDEALCSLLVNGDKVLVELNQLDEKLKQPEIDEDTIQSIKNMQDKLKPAILKAAELGHCIIHERAAMEVLRDFNGVFKVMIQANDFDQKLFYALTDPKRQSIKSKSDVILEEDKPIITEYIYNQDHIRRHYHNTLSKMAWGDISTYDLILNSDRLSIEQCGSVLKSILDISF